MPKLEITQSHKVTAAEAKTKLEGLSQELSNAYGLTSKWHSDTEANVKATGASGTIKIEPTQVSVKIELSMALFAIKGKVETKIKEELKKLFA